MSSLREYDREETRWRKQVVSKEEVFAELQDNKWHSKRDMANHFDVSSGTIAARVRDLAEDGKAVLMGRFGYRFVAASDITDEETAEAIQAMSRWMIGIVTRQAMTARPMKRLMTEARKMLPKSKDERQIVRKYLVQLTHLIDWNEEEE